MISTKDLSGLPNAERLKNFCKGLAALDIIMVEEEWSFIRHYTYNPAWRKGKEAFFATDGSDQSMIVMFAPEGCVINGVDSELYDWEEKLPRIEDLTDGMPPALQKLMGSREVKKMKSTFCVWTEDGSTWHCNPMDGEDASKDLLSTIDGNPQSYVDYGKWFYPADLPLETVRQLADVVPVTKELVTALNPKRSKWEEIKAGLDKIGYWDGSKSEYIKKPNQQEETSMPTTEWLNKYESVKDKLACKTDLDAHFTEKVIGNMGVDVLDIGAVLFPTGTIFACDPLVELEDTPPFIQTIPAGTYPVKICVVPSEKYGDRYACVKVEVSREKPVRYELGMTGKEDLDEELGEDEYFGFGVDAGMGCVADIQTQAAFKTYWAKRLEEDPDIDPYNDLFCDLLEENAKAHPKYQGDCGDWLNWTVPDTDCNLPIFASGWGDGYYPVYFGYDAKGEVCAVYVRFIDIEASYKEQA